MAKSREIFKFELTGIKAMTSKLDKLEGEIEARLIETMGKLADQVVADAKALAPVGPGSGDLLASIRRSEVRKEKGNIVVEIGNSPETNDYATVQHEGFMHTKGGKLVELTAGPVTASKPAHGGYMPGKKFLENALKMNEQRIIEDLLKILY